MDAQRNLSQCLISPKASIKSAMRKMQQSNQTTLFVTDGQRKLVGAMTDGDIRRSLLKNGNLKGSVISCCNRSPISLTAPYDKQFARGMILDNEIEHLAIVDKNKCVIEVLSRKQLLYANIQHSVNIPVVIMAGGRGMRLEPFTKILPKPLMPVGDKPIIEIIMDKFHRHGVQSFFLTINYKGDMIRSYFDNTELPYNIQYIEEKEFLGTAGSLKLLPDDFPHTFLISNCDITVETDFNKVVEFHKQGKFSITVLGAFYHFQVPYGVIDFENDGAIKAIREKPTVDYTINTGVYIAEKDVLRYIPDGSLFHMTDLIKVLLKKRKRVGIYHVHEDSFIDIGEWSEYKKNINKILAATEG